MEELVKIVGVLETCAGASELEVDISTEAGVVDVDNSETSQTFGKYCYARIFYITWIRGGHWNFFAIGWA